jgi:hypothetical protein
MRVLLLLALFILSALLAVMSEAQTDEQVRAILFLSGAESMESLDEQELEKYSNLLSRPLEINILPQSKLISSGLMTPFQAASLYDYKAHNGDILSFAELSSVDGFSEEFVAALRPFISLRSSRMPGEFGTSPKLTQDAILKGGVRDGTYSLGLKYKIGYKEYFEASTAIRNTYSQKEPSYTLNVALHGKKLPCNLIIGDFNARYAQGLCLWSGFSLSGFSGASSFMRRPTGLSPSWPYSQEGSHRGVAGDIYLGRFVVSALASFIGLRKRMESGRGDIDVLPALNVTWLGRNGQAGVTGTDRKASVDFRWTAGGSDIFGECAYDIRHGSLAGVAGIIFNFEHDWKLSAAARYYPSDFDDEYTGGIRSWSMTSNEIAFSAGVERLGFSFAADLARKADAGKAQGKFMLKLPLQINRNMVLSVKASERLRTYDGLHYRTDVRLDLDYSSSGISSAYGISDGSAWTGRFRVEGLACKSLGMLAYLEGGRKTDFFSTYLRGTIFRIDDWDDRIYSYERDAPGNFSVPAYYGRGLSIVWTAGCKIRLHERPWRSMKIYAKALRVQYFKSSAHKSRTELKIQLVFDL